MTTDDAVRSASARDAIGSNVGRDRGGDSGAWTGFLVMAFAVVGLIGIFATFAAQIPLQQALGRSAALDQALAVGGAPDAGARLAALRPALGDAADGVIGGQGPLEVRVAAARSELRAKAAAAASDVGFRLRIVIAAFTGAAALFGTAVLSIVRRAKPGT